MTPVLPTLDQQVGEILGKSNPHCSMQARRGRTPSRSPAPWSEASRWLNCAILLKPALDGSQAGVEFDFADGYSTPGKLVEIEVTAQLGTRELSPGPFPAREGEDVGIHTACSTGRANGRAADGRMRLDLVVDSETAHRPPEDGLTPLDDVDAELRRSSGSMIPPTGPVRRTEMDCVNLRIQPFSREPSAWGYRDSWPRP